MKHFRELRYMHKMSHCHQNDWGLAQHCVWKMCMNKYRCSPTRSQKWVIIHLSDVLLGLKQITSKQFKLSCLYVLTLVIVEDNWKYPEQNIQNILISWATWRLNNQQANKRSIDLFIGLFLFLLLMYLLHKERRKKAHFLKPVLLFSIWSQNT